MSNFLDRKIKTLFARFDINNNGFINIADFTLWGDRLIKAGHLNTQNQAELRRCLTTLWYHYFCPMDANHDSKVTCLELSKHIQTCIHDESKKQNWKCILPLIFEAIDSDKDGHISKDEFDHYFQSLNINDKAMSDEVFSGIDENKDGFLSSGEFLAFGEHFFTETDEAHPSKHFFGKLVD